MSDEIRFDINPIYDTLKAIEKSSDVVYTNISKAVEMFKALGVQGNIKELDAAIESSIIKQKKLLSLKSDEEALLQKQIKSENLLTIAIENKKKLEEKTSQEVIKSKLLEETVLQKQIKSENDLKLAIEKNKQAEIKTAQELLKIKKLELDNLNKEKKINKEINDAKNIGNFTAQQIKLLTSTEETQKSMFGLRREIRELQKAMDIAGEKGNVALYNKIGKKIGQLKNDVRDLNTALLFTDPGEFLNGVIKIADGVTGAFSAVDAGMKLAGSDNEELNKIMGKTAATLELLEGLERARALAEGKGVAQGIAQQLKSLFVKEELIATTIAETTTTEGAAVAQTELNVAMSANPIGIVIAAVVALTGAIIAFDRIVHSSTQAQQDLRDIQEKSIESSSKERVELDTLFVRLDKVKNSKEQYKNVINEINENYGKYLPNLLTEKSSLKDIEDAHNRITQAIIKQAQIEAYKDKITDLYKEMAELSLKSSDVVNNTEDLWTSLKEGVSEYGFGLSETSAKMVQLINNHVEQAEIKERIKSLQDLMNEQDLFSVKTYEHKTEAVKENSKAVKENSKAVKENAENHEALLKVQKAENDEAEMIAAWKKRNEEQKQYDELLKMMQDYYKTSQQLGEENLQAEYRINLALLESRGATEEQLEQLSQIYADKLSKLKKEVVSKATESKGNDKITNESILKSIFPDFSDEQIGYLKDGFNSALSQYSQFIESRKELAKQDVENSTNRINELNNKLQAEIQLNQQGYASNIQLRLNQIAQEESIRNAAIEKEKQAAKIEAAISSSQVVASTAVSVANIFKTFSSIPFVGYILAGIQAAAMIASIQSYVNKAKTIATYAHGVIGIKRGNNATGTDTIPAYTSWGEEIRVNEGESIMPTQATNKYYSTLTAIRNDEPPRKVLASFANDINKTSDRDILSRIEENTRYKQEQYYQTDKYEVYIDGNRTRYIKK